MINDVHTKSSQRIAERLSAANVTHECINGLLRYGWLFLQENPAKCFGTGRKKLTDSQGKQQKANSGHGLQT